MRAGVLLLLECFVQILQTNAFHLTPIVAHRLLATPQPLRKVPTALRGSQRASLFGLKAAAITDTETSAPAAAERYVVFNRFTVRDNAGPRFEKRWADRKSSLKVLDGFRFFTLLRRADGVSVSGRVIEYEEGTPDYMSMTIWQTKKNFNSWRTGYAFKEAHGGGSIGGFLSAMLGSMMVIKTPPTPAMWDALCVISTPTPECELVLKNRDAEGRAVTAGTEALPMECFVAMNRFPVKTECGKEFEDRWAQRSSKLKGTPGFLGFFILRRDRPAAAAEASTQKGGGGSSLPDDKYTYSTCTVWANKGDWASWSDGDGKSAHEASTKRSEAGAQQPLRELLNGEASPVFWEGVLALQSEAGV